MIVSKLTFDADELGLLGPTVFLQPVGVDEPRSIICRIGENRAMEGGVSHQTRTPAGGGGERRLFWDAGPQTAVREGEDHSAEPSCARPSLVAEKVEPDKLNNSASHDDRVPASRSSSPRFPVVPDARTAVGWR